MIAASTALAYTGLTLVNGSLVVHALASPDDGEASRLRRRAARRAALGAALVLVAAAARGVLQVAAFADAEEPWWPVVRAIAGTTFGRALLGQGIVAVVALAGALVASRGVGGGWLIVWPTAIASGAALATGGHAAASATPLAAVLTASVHATAAGAWIGGLWHLTAEARQAPLSAVRSLLSRFHRVALAAATLVTGTGLVHVVESGASVSVMLTSPWGRLLGLKLVLLAAVMALGFRHWRTGDRVLAGAAPHRLQRTLWSESVLALLVLAVAGTLSSTAPPEEPTATSSAKRTNAPSHRPFSDTHLRGNGRVGGHPDPVPAPALPDVNGAGGASGRFRPAGFVARYDCAGARGQVALGGFRNGTPRVGCGTWRL